MVEDNVKYFEELVAPALANTECAQVACTATRAAICLHYSTRTTKLRLTIRALQQSYALDLVNVPRADGGFDIYVVELNPFFEMTGTCHFRWGNDH